MAQKPSQKDLEQRAEAGDGAAANLLGDHYREAWAASRTRHKPFIGIARVLSRASPSRSTTSPNANGALMRVSPLGILGGGAEDGKAGEWAGQDATLTHPNPICQHANMVYAEALAFAIRTGSNADQVYRFAVEMANRAKSPQSITEVLIKAASKPPDDYSRQMGWVLIALQNAFWQLLHAVNLEEGIVSTVMSGQRGFASEAGGDACLRRRRAGRTTASPWRCSDGQPTKGMRWHSIISESSMPRDSA